MHIDIVDKTKLRLKSLTKITYKINYYSILIFYLEFIFETTSQPRIYIIHKIIRADVPFNLFLCFLITDVLENNLSVGTEIAIISKISVITFDKIG